jgi:two-component system cell cycle sensor histidine kinase/response regulator CckA
VIVDDDKAMLNLIAEHLRNRKFTVFATSVARDAYLYLLDHRNERCLLISDVVLKGESGWELAHEARKHLPNLPVLLVSGCIEQRTLSTGGEAQNLSFLQKPFTLRSLESTVGSLFGRSTKVGQPA